MVDPKKEFYLEYEIHKNKPGLLGAITTLLGMLEINILTVNSINQVRRGFLLEYIDEGKIIALKNALFSVESIRITAFRIPTLLDRLALRHGQRLDMAKTDPPTYRFTREDLGVLVDFLGDTLLEGGHRIIGVRGLPRVGKTEAAISACVYAKKKWVLLSSTIFRQTIRRELLHEEKDNSVFLIDGITSTTRGDSSHWELLKGVLDLPIPKIIEHPDVFLRDGSLYVDFDLMIELRNKPEDDITMDDISMSFSSFDIS